MTVIRKIWHDPVWSKIIAAGIVALITAAPAVIYWNTIWAWLQNDHQSRGWMLGLLIMGSIVGVWRLSIAFAGSFTHSHARPFRPVVAQDLQCGIEWLIQVHPKHWAEVESSRFGPEAVRDILIGPFHLTNGCHHEVQLLKAPRDFGPDVLRPFCPRCEDPEDITGPEEPADQETERDVRFEAIKELQRMHRAGTRLTGEVVLEKPQYWRRMQLQRG